MPTSCARIVPVIFPRGRRLRGGARLHLPDNLADHPELSRLGVGAAGHVHGGDRLPWVRKEGADNFVSLSKMAWQVHVYVAAKPELARWCADHHVDLQAFVWTPQHEAAGFARDALYLLRPDTYVGLADPSGTPEAVDRYFAGRGLRFMAETATEPAHE